MDTMSLAGDLTAARQAALAQTLAVRVMAKVNEAAKAEGEAALKLIESASVIRSPSVGNRIDVYA